jgi:hypothetical protein
MRIVFLTCGVADPAAGGGPRRSHQLLHELSAAFGASQVIAINAAELFPLPTRSTGVLERARTRVSNALANPFQWRSRDRFGPRRLQPASLARYRQLLGRLDEPTVVIIEESRLASLLPVNARLNVSTVLAPWVFSALTMNLVDLAAAMSGAGNGLGDDAADRAVLAAMTSHGQEMIWGRNMLANWRLSLLEHRLLRACGAQSTLMPYYPAGEAETLLRNVHRDRRPQSGVFVISGGSIAPNQMALEAFLTGLTRDDIPPDTRLVIAGTTDVPAAWIRHLGDVVEHVGRLPDDQFHDLLCRAHYVLVPQTLGFGCQTRIADMLCAGVPMLAGSQVAAGVGAVPGVRYVEDSIGGWARAIREARATTPSTIDAAVFTSWQAEQRSLLRNGFSELARAH